MGEFHVDGLGVVRDCERVSAGAFDLYRGELDGVAVAIKVKGLGFPDDNAYVAEHSVVFSRLYSAIGYAGLAAAAHGDLHGSNIILAPGRDRFVLIDPAVFLVDHDLRASGDSKSRCSFTTHPRYYPLLPPYYLPRTRLRDAPYLASQFEAFRWALSGCYRVGPGCTAGGPTQGFAELPVGRDEPGPADLLAVGILYYDALTGEHPFYDDEFTEPGWLGGVCLEGFRGSDTGFDPALVRLARPVVPPVARASDVHPDESALAMALLELRVHDLETLVARAYPAAVATQR